MTNRGGVQQTVQTGVCLGGVQGLKSTVLVGVSRTTLVVWTESEMRSVLTVSQVSGCWEWVQQPYRFS